MIDWIGKALTFEALVEGTEETMPVAPDTPSKSERRGKLDQACETLRSVLGSTRKALSAKASRLNQRYSVL